MKITDKRNDKRVMFCHLLVGTVFQVPPSDHFYMKTSIVDDADGDILTNAVRLDNGLAHKFDDDINVIKFDAELIIT